MASIQGRPDPSPLSPAVLGRPMFRLAHSEINSGHCSEVGTPHELTGRRQHRSPAGKGPFTWSRSKDRAGRGGLPQAVRVLSAGRGPVPVGDSKEDTRGNSPSTHLWDASKAQGGHHHTPSCKGQWLGWAAGCRQGPTGRLCASQLEHPWDPDRHAQGCLLVCGSSLGRRGPSPSSTELGAAWGEEPTTPVQGPCETPSRLGGQWP